MSTRNVENSIETQVITVTHCGASHKILLYEQICLDELNSILSALFPTIAESKILALKEISRDVTDGTLTKSIVILTKRCYHSILYAIKTS